MAVHGLLMETIKGLLASLTVNRFLFVCFVLSLVGLTLSSFEGYLTWNPVLTLSTFSFFFLCVYFANLMRIARRKTYLDLIGDHVYDKYEWAALVFKDVEEFIPKKNLISWKLKNGNMVGAKIFSIVDVPYTFKELTTEELDRRLRSYSHLINIDDIPLVTYHMKLPVDKESYVETLRRDRDVLETSYDAGGPKSHMERAEEKEAVIRRIKKGLEEPYDARFFVALLMKGDSLEEIHRKLEDATPSVLTRLKNDIGVVVKELTDMDLLDACSFFFRSPTWTFP